MDQKRSSSSKDGEGKDIPSSFSRVKNSVSRASHLVGDRATVYHGGTESGARNQRVVRELKSLLSDLIERSELSMAVAGQDLRMCGRLRQIQRTSLNAFALLGRLPEGVGSRTGVFRTVDISELVRQCEVGLRLLLPFGATLQFRCPGLVMPARVDPIILEKILCQFAASSLTGFDAPGAIEIEVGWRSSGAELNQQVAISIACNTFGELDTSTQANEPDRVDVGAERESTSIALDISAATDMLSSCGGSLCVDYIPGRRHSLLVTLPRSGDDLEELPLRDASGFLPIGTETVIVVQREATTREAVCHILGAQGYTVLEAASNGEAVEMAWNLEPGETALVVAEFIDSIGRGASEGSELGRLRSNVRHLYTSAYVDAGTDAPLLTEADGDFVDSPFTPRSLVYKVREVLDRDAR